MKVKHSPYDTVYILLTQGAIQRKAMDCGLRGNDLISACVSEAAGIREFQRVYDLAPKWPRARR